MRPHYIDKSAEKLNRKKIMNDVEMETTQSEFEKYLRNISYFLTFGWLIITFAVILWLLKYKDLKKKSQQEKNEDFNDSIINRDECVYVSV